jgi:tRNA(fMet)-specific endonuclease VapC
MRTDPLAELEYGSHRKGRRVCLRNALTQVLLRIDVVTWDEDVATGYGEFCATLEAQGINLSDFDMMIAAHAVAANAILVSRDKAFAQVPVGENQKLRLEIW